LVADGGGRGAGVLVERAGDALARSRSEASISTSQFDSTPNWPTATSRTTRAVARHPWRDAGRHDHRHRRWAGRAIDQGAFTCSPGAAVQCGLTDLAPGESESLEVHIRSLRPGRLIDDVTASDDQFDPNYANDSATVIATVTPRATAARVRIVPVRRVATPGHVVSFIVTVGAVKPAPGVKPTVCVMPPSQLRVVHAPGAVAPARRLCWDADALVDGSPRTFTLLRARRLIIHNDARGAGQAYRFEPRGRPGGGHRRGAAAAGRRVPIALGARPDRLLISLLLRQQRGCFRLGRGRRATLPAVNAGVNRLPGLAV
jgi:hypothetical protein